MSIDPSSPLYDAEAAGAAAEGSSLLQRADKILEAKLPVIGSGSQDNMLEYLQKCFTETEEMARRDKVDNFQKPTRCPRI